MIDDNWQRYYGNFDFKAERFPDPKAMLTRLKKKNIETISLDYDMDEELVKEYNPGKILPIFIFMNNDKEIRRVIGEKSVEEMLNIINEVGEEDD